MPDSRECLFLEFTADIPAALEWSKEKPQRKLVTMIKELELPLAKGGADFEILSPSLLFCF